jgi:dimethylaniline monooxygenase (N-oxide forming)
MSGLSGLAAAKQCLDEGIVPTVFESRDRIGGQWAYEDADPAREVHSSVYNGVISNSCRDTSNFSDFPIDPSRYPDYYGHELVLRYIQAYADHFGVENYVRFNAKVQRCDQLYDNRWQVKYTEHGAGPVVDSYDALFICTGKYNEPNIPTFNGMENFRGDIIHSRVYRRPDSYAGKKVALVGFGPSAVDIASEICGQAKACHLITRRGGWVVPRYVLGKPAEACQSK